jgi:hypothetical protein
VRAAVGPSPPRSLSSSDVCSPCPSIALLEQMRALAVACLLVALLGAVSAKRIHRLQAELQAQTLVSQPLSSSLACTSMWPDFLLSSCLLL